MILNPRWLPWLSDEEDEYGNRRMLKKDVPNDIRKEYESLLKEEQDSIKKNKLKKTIFKLSYKFIKKINLDADESLFCYFLS